ncbi:uncharacterized protein [Pseudochaenichthys georgianus]|uniref:uncharacterized protein n=1 Tax=Pseudochaenichthys georgianus TaxID=52239 RepID=UPI0039C18784
MCQQTSTYQTRAPHLLQGRMETGQAERPPPSINHHLDGHASRAEGWHRQPGLGRRSSDIRRRGHWRAVGPLVAEGVPGLRFLAGRPATRQPQPVSRQPLPYIHRGGLDQDRFLRAMLQLRNTPDPDCNLSPAQIIFGRPLRGSLSFVNRLEKFSNPHIRLLWREAWAAKEDALRTRMSRTTESLGTHSRPLRPLALGESVFLQNQQGPSPHKWDRSGIVVESPGHDQYRIRVDGSGRLTLRNRRFLRAYTPATPCAREQPAAPLPPPAALDHQPPPIHPGWATPQGIAQRPAVGPRDSAMGTSPPAPAGEASSDLTVPTGAFLGAPVPQSPPMLPQPTRPGRVRRPPARYEPESGSWI